MAGLGGSRRSGGGGVLVILQTVCETTSETVSGALESSVETTLGDVGGAMQAVAAFSRATMIRKRTNERREFMLTPSKKLTF